MPHYISRVFRARAAEGLSPLCGIQSWWAQISEHPNIRTLCPSRTRYVGYNRTFYVTKQKIRTFPFPTLLLCLRTEHATRITFVPPYDIATKAKDEQSIVFNATRNVSNRTYTTCATCRNWNTEQRSRIAQRPRDPSGNTPPLSIYKYLQENCERTRHNQSPPLLEHFAQIVR